MLSCLLFAGTASSLAQDVLTQQHVIVAHRGGKFEVEENTMAGFREALANGMRAFETDFHFTKDDKLVIMHDGNVKRMTGVDEDIEATNLSDLLTLRTPKGNKIPTGEEYVNLMSHYDYMYCEFEMKTSESKYYPDERLRKYCDALYNLVMSKKPAHSVYVFTSFEDRTLNMMHELHPDAKLCYILSGPIDEKTIVKAMELHAYCIAGKLDKTTREMVVKAHRVGLTVSLWQTNTPETWLRAAMLGADVSTNDAPVATKKWMDENCKWIKYQLGPNEK